MIDRGARLFPAEAVTFLEGLAADNSRAYFTVHRDVYDAALRRPLEELTARAEERYGSGRVMRPNRDVRFSNDKSPYRLDASMYAGSVGGVYLQFSRAGIEAGGGLYEPTRDQLARARQAIDSRPLAAAQLRDLRDELEAAGFEWAGPGLATAPRGYDRDHPAIELLRLKHYAAVRSLPVDATVGQVEQAWSAVEPLIRWSEEYVGAALSWP